MDAAQQRILNARRRGDELLDLCRKAASIGNSRVPSALVGNLGGDTFGTRESTAMAAECYEHFRGWIYVAVNIVARRVAGQQVFVSDRRTAGTMRVKALRTKSSMGDLYEPMAQHPVLDLFARPNPIMISSSVLYSTVASLLLCGRAYFWFIEDDETNELQLWPCPADWVTPNRLYTKYEIRIPGSAEPVHVDGRFVCPFRLPDPSDPFGSTSPLAAQSRTVESDDAITLAQLEQLRQGVNPSLVLTVGRHADPDGKMLTTRPILTPAQRTQLINAVLQMHAGALSNRRNPLILDGLVESVSPFMRSAVEMDFANSEEIVKRRLMQTIGVNPIVAGDLQNANRAAALVAEQAFCANVRPIVELLGHSMTRWMVPLFSRGSEDLIIWVEELRANDPEMVLKEVQFAAQYGAITKNEIRSRILGWEELPGMDDPVAGRTPALPPPAARPAGTPGSQRAADESADDDARDDAQDRAAKRLAKLVYGRASRNGRHR